MLNLPAISLSFKMSAHTILQENSPEIVSYVTHNLKQEPESCWLRKITEHNSKNTGTKSHLATCVILCGLVQEILGRLLVKPHRCSQFLKQLIHRTH